MTLCICNPQKVGKIIIFYAINNETDLGGGLRALLFEVVELHDLGHDEALLEVGVDAPGRLRRLGELLDGPGLHLVRARREEVLQSQGLVALHDYLLEAAAKRKCLHEVREKCKSTQLG